MQCNKRTGTIVSVIITYVKNMVTAFKKIVFLATSGALVLLSGCAPFVKPPAEPALVKLTEKEVNAYLWEDGMDREGLRAAVEQSIRYYKRLPADRIFRFGEFVYTSEEMRASLELFLEIMQNYKGNERIQQVRDMFLFFESRNSNGGSFFTGYYEPVLDASPVPTDELSSPLYTTPDDVIVVDLGQFRNTWKDETVIGRIKGRRLLPYDTREKIVYHGTLKGRAKTIAFVNEIELFFLQIQGSGIIRFSDGGLRRVNFAMHNGQPYRAIGRILKDKIPEEEMSMQAIKKYLYAHPEEVREILTYNPSYTFFREVPEGPLGDIEVPLTAERSIAMDRRVIPRGSLAYVETEVPVFTGREMKGKRVFKRFMLVQDTGGAIRDHGRADIFFGHDRNAELMAGHLKGMGRVFLIVARKEFLE
jgi:membrane-bound lytic murein transglycosylase A